MRSLSWRPLALPLRDQRALAYPVASPPPQPSSSARAPREHAEPSPLHVLPPLSAPAPGVPSTWTTPPGAPRWSRSLPPPARCRASAHRFLFARPDFGAASFPAGPSALAPVSRRTPAAPTADTGKSPRRPGCSLGCPAPLLYHHYRTTSLPYSGTRVPVREQAQTTSRRLVRPRAPQGPAPCPMDPAWPAGPCVAAHPVDDPSWTPPAASRLHSRPQKCWPSSSPHAHLGFRSYTRTRCPDRSCSNARQRSSSLTCRTISATSCPCSLMSLQPRTVSRRRSTQDGTRFIRCSASQSTCVSHIVVTRPRLSPARLPCVGTCSSSKRALPIRCMWASSGMSSPRSVRLVTASFMSPMSQNLCIASTCTRTVSRRLRQLIGPGHEPGHAL
jgi:hypothetical protein